jgi:hypothetical protein
LETVCAISGYIATNFFTGAEDKRFGFQVEFVYGFYCVRRVMLLSFMVHLLAIEPVDELCLGLLFEKKFGLQL